MSALSLISWKLCQRGAQDFIFFASTPSGGSAFTAPKMAKGRSGIVKPSRTSLVLLLLCVDLRPFGGLGEFGNGQPG